MRSRWMTGIFMMMLPLLLSCGRGESSRFLIVTHTTHFVIQGNGTALNFPVFAGTMDIVEVERDLNLAEYYHRKLSALYDFKSFTLVQSRTSEALISHQGRWQSSQSIYEHKDSLSWVQLSLVGYSGHQASYDFLIINQQDNQFKSHVVEVPSGRSASIGLLFDTEHNRGHLMVVSMMSTEINSMTQPLEFAEFLRQKNRIGDSSRQSAFNRSDQKWMDELFGIGAYPLPIRESASESGGEEMIEYDTPPSPVGGMASISGAVVYPEQARRENIQGRVLVKIWIDREGRVTRHKIEKGIREDLDQAVIDALKSAAFHPATLDGHPVACWVMVPIEFTLE